MRLNKNIGLRYFTLLLSILAFSSQNLFAQCQYLKSRTITIDDNQVSGAIDFVDFPVFLSLTNSNFKTTANGGLIQNANGYDVKLMLKDCSCWLDFIIHSYDGNTGTFEIYVNVPNLKASEPTILEFFYGNASVSVDPSSDTTYSSARTADWIATQNANRNSPSTFYAVGSQKEADCAGPGGIDTMDGTSNLVLWLKADCGVENSSNQSVLDGGAVAIWRDQSGYGIDATEATNQPDYQLNQVQGNAALNFTAANGDRILSAGVSDANEYMIFIVAEPTSFSSNNIGLVHAAPSGNGFSTNTNTKSIGMWVSNAGVFWGRLIQANGTFVNYNQTSTVDAGVYFILTNYADGNTTTGQYLRGVDASVTSTYNGTVQEWVDFGIGRQGNESWNGHIAEVIVYNRNLGVSERGLVENYLAAKYGAEIPRLTGTTGPAGIGEKDGSSRLEVWFAANDLDGDGITEGTSESGQSSGVISSWSDKSGHGHDLATGTATFATSTTGLNDQPSVGFNGINEYLQTANVDLASANALEYFVVFDDAAVDAANNAALINWQTVAPLGGFSFESRTFVGRMRNQYYQGGGATNLNTNGFTTTDPYIYNTTYGPSGLSHIRNGTTLSSSGTAISLDNPASAPFAIGRNISSGADYFAADVAEFISFSVELNAAEKEILTQYLSAKYGIPLSGADYYAGHAAGYVQSVQGIGTSDGTLVEGHVESNASDGLVISMANSSFDVANEYVFAGNDGRAGGTTTDDLSSLPAVVRRINKVWYLDKTGAVDIKLTFNLQESVGTNIFPEGNGYVLLYSSVESPFSFEDYTATYGLSPVVSNEDISFVIPDAQLLNGYYTLATTDDVNNPLPIELLSFGAIPCELHVCVEWVTVSETDNDYFEVERSADAKKWTSVGNLNGAGNSTDLKYYNLIDKQPIKGASYYRLKQVDYDGAFSYSEIKRVMFTIGSDLEIYPNPASDYFVIIGENLSFYEISLYQLDGKRITLKTKENSQNQVTVDTSNLPAGIYTVYLRSQTFSISKRLVITK